MTPPDGTAERTAATEAAELPAPSRRTNRTAIASFTLLLSMIGIVMGLSTL